MASKIRHLVFEGDALSQGKSVWGLLVPQVDVAASVRLFFQFNRGSQSNPEPVDSSEFFVEVVGGPKQQHRYFTAPADLTVGFLTETFLLDPVHEHLLIVNVWNTTGFTWTGHIEALLMI